MTKAPSGRELSPKVTEGERVTMRFDLISMSRRLLPSASPPPSSRRKAWVGVAFRNIGLRVCL